MSNTGCSDKWDAEPKRRVMQKAALEQGQKRFAGDETHLLEQVKDKLFTAVIKAFISFQVFSIL